MFKTIILSLLLSVTLLGETMITSGSGARMRPAPKTGGKTIVSLPVGEIVTVLQRGDKRETIGKMQNYWYKVKHNNQTGWIYGASLLPFDAKHQNYIVRHIIKDRLAQKRSFAEYADTTRFVKKLQTTINDPGFWLELEFYRMQLLAQSVQALQQKSSAMKHPWYTENKEELFYHEMAGGYYLKTQFLWKAIDKKIKQPAADPFAWYTSKQDIGGECEGEVGCYMGMIILTTGAYLKRFPAGQFYKIALAQIYKNIKQSQSEIISQKRYSKKHINDNLSELLKIVQKCDTTTTKPLITLIQNLLKK